MNPTYPIILGFMPAYRIYGYRHPIAIQTCNYYWTVSVLKVSTNRGITKLRFMR